MKISLGIIILMSGLFACATVFADGWIEGYIGSDGVYVPGYYRSTRDDYQWDLYDYDDDGTQNMFDYDDDDDGYLDAGDENPHNPWVW